MDIHAPDLASLKASLWNKAAALTHPPKEDELLRTIYRTPEIRGDIVLAGEKTRGQQPITDLPEYRIHFIKTNLGDPELDTKAEYIKHRQIYESWKTKTADAGPIPIPRPLAYGPTTFRSELIFGITLAAASPCKIKKGNPPQSFEHWLAILSPLKSIPVDWQKKYWDGLTSLSLAIYHLQILNHVAHKDLHKENMMLVPQTDPIDPNSQNLRSNPHNPNIRDTQNNRSLYLPALIDFETAKFDPETREKQSDFHHLLHEARLLLTGPLGDDPVISQTQLAEIALHQAHRVFDRFDLDCLEKCRKTIRLAVPKPGQTIRKKPDQKTIRL